MLGLPTSWSCRGPHCRPWSCKPIPKVGITGVRLGELKGKLAAPFCLASAVNEKWPTAVVGADAFDWLVIREDCDGEGGRSSVRLTIVMSWMLDLLLSLPPELSLMKYFCAWLATWVGVLVWTKLRDMFRQSPLPYFLRPKRNNLTKEQSTILFSNFLINSLLHLVGNTLATGRPSYIKLRDCRRESDPTRQIKFPGLNAINCW